jgi:hypothetical protein
VAEAKRQAGELMARKSTRITVVADQIWMLRRTYSREWVKTTQSPTEPAVSATNPERNLQPTSRLLWNTWDSERKLLKGL